MEGRNEAKLKVTKICRRRRRQQTSECLPTPGDRHEANGRIIMLIALPTVPGARNVFAAAPQANNTGLQEEYEACQ